jgi:hypothetical protein
MSQIFTEADIEEEQKHFSKVITTFQQYAQYSAGISIITARHCPHEPLAMLASGQ